MDDLHEYMTEVFGIESPGPWASVYARGPGTGERGPRVEALKTQTRRKNLAARRAANRAHYAQQESQPKSRVKQFQPIESGTSRG